MKFCPVRIGDIVGTSYESGPYRIEKISPPCRCPPFGWTVNNLGVPEEDVPNFPIHWHLTCSWAGRWAGGREYGNYYLTIEADLRCAGSMKDRVIIVERSREPIQLEMFQDE
jgi:hypothetical protein